MTSNSSLPALNIALYGGAFDPPHIGHTAFCEALCQDNHFDQVWILPSFFHPFDKKLTDFQLRLGMCRIAFARISEKVVISREESFVPGKGYTLDLLKHLKDKFPEHKFTLTLGADNFQSRHRWKGFEEIENLVEVKFFGRKGNDEENATLGLETPFPEVSSSQLRKTLQSGEMPDQLLPPGIPAFISRNNLYR